MQSVVSLSIILLVVAFAMYRRMQPQPVRPQRAVVLAVIIVVLSALSLAGSNQLTDHPLAVILALPALLVGFGLGYLLMQSITFWRDHTTGALWMKGGVVYLAVWLVTLALRQWVAYASGTYAPHTTGSQPISPTLAIISADLVIVSIGLWIARATALMLKYRAYERSGVVPAR
jgi:uncharacterized membrane protein YvlD (DUF360 family)